jgi:hypothetical protein
MIAQSRFIRDSFQVENQQQPDKDGKIIITFIQDYLSLIF